MAMRAMVMVCLCALPGCGADAPDATDGIAGHWLPQIPAKWLGTYRTGHEQVQYGDGRWDLGLSVTLTASQLSYSRCSAGACETHSGVVTVAFDEGIAVEFDGAASETDRLLLSPRWFFASWDERQFLVPESLMIRFVSDYNQSGSPRQDLPAAPAKVGDATPRFHGTDIFGDFSDNRVIGPADPIGPPELPLQYAQLIIDKPLTVVALRNGSVRPVEGYCPAVPLVFRGGRNLGLYPGLNARVMAGAVKGRVVIDEVSSDSAEGRLFAWVDSEEEVPREFSVDWPGADDPTLKPGSRYRADPW
jgi:hypothetical protein